jgi:hypothetical protein
VTESRKSFSGGVHNCGAKDCFHARSAKLPEFQRFCPQTAVNHENVAVVGFARKIGYRY